MIEHFLCCLVMRAAVEHFMVATTSHDFVLALFTLQKELWA